VCSGFATNALKKIIDGYVLHMKHCLYELIFTEACRVKKMAAGVIVVLENVSIISNSVCHFQEDINLERILNMTSITML